MKKIAGFAILLAVLGSMVFTGCGKQGGSRQSTASSSQGGSRQTTVSPPPEEWNWRRKVTIISPWGPGGGLGPTIRNLVPELEKVIGVPVEVQHVEGGGGLQGTVFAQRQPADGYTFVAGTQSTVALDIRDQLGFDFREEFLPVGKMVHSTKGILASKVAVFDRGLFRDFQGFLNYARANPGQLNVGMRSPGGADEASLIETLALAYNVPMSQARNFVKVVPYGSGAEMDAAMMGGHIQLTLQGLNESPGIISSGDIIPLVVLSENRMKSFPDVPATGQDFRIASYIGTWRGIFARKGTPQAAIDSLDKAMREAWHSPAYQQFCAAEGYLERTGYESQADFKKLIDEEYKAMTEFLRAAGMIR